MNPTRYPKVLIVGESFNSITGTGITLKNLFNDYPKEKIALVSDFNITNNDNTFCSNNYRVSNKYLKRNGSLKKPAKNNGIIYSETKLKTRPKNEGKESSSLFKKSVARAKYLINIFIKKLAGFFGLTPLLYSLNINKSLDRWVVDQQPEIIFTFLNNYRHFELVKHLQTKHKLPVVVHSMDDHIKRMAPWGLLYWYWRKKMNGEFMHIVKSASALFSISGYMSEVYKKRYDLDFLPFMNPLDRDYWLPSSKKSWKAGNVFKICYLGRYGNDNSVLLHQLASLVEQLNSSGFSVVFELRLGVLTNSAHLESFAKYKFSYVSDYLDHKELPEYLANCDLLYLPLGFSKKSKEQYHVSMSTKVPEYMISGTPILVQAPADTAYYQYAQQEKWGYALPSGDRFLTEQALMDLLQNEQLRKKLGRRAVEVALQNHDARKVRADFYKALKEAVSYKH